MSIIDRWANFLSIEKLNPQRVDPLFLINFCEELAKRGEPKFSPYAKKLASRDLVVKTAMDLGIDLAGIKYNGKIAMARSLLDAWNKEYAHRFGTIFGTAGWREDKRRKIKTNRKS